MVRLFKITDRQIKKDKSALMNVDHQSGSVMYAVIHIAGYGAILVTFAGVLW